MKALPAIARYMRLPEEQLRYPIELIQQGYEPNYLAAFRPDELGGIEVEILARLKRAIEYETALAEHKERVVSALERDNQSSESAQRVIEECTSVSQVDAIARSLRSKKNAKVYAEEFPYVEGLGQAILMHSGTLPEDLNAWVAQQTGLPVEQAEEALQRAKHWLQMLMSEDPKLLLHLQRAVLKNAVVSLTILPEPAKGDESESDTASDDAPSTTPGVPAAPTTAAPTTATPTTAASSTTISSSAEVASVDSASVSPLDALSDEATAAVSDASPSPEAQAGEVVPLIEQFHQGRKQAKAIRTKSLSEKPLSPRQRRRRWLRHILESYSKLKKPLRSLTPYQILVIARGIRSRIIDLNFQQDLRSLTQACREALYPGRHPFHALLMEVAESGLNQLLLPRIHQDVLSILEEDAHQELIEAAVLQLQNNLLQRPVRGHRILLIDSVGIKTAAIAIIDEAGDVVATSEMPCNSSKPDIVAQNMSLLGQLVHQHRVTLIALSNGPARRYLMPAVVELLKQSTEGSLYWTLVDRSGCDAYTQSRTSLVELPRISRRHRAAVWMAWRLQDPLRQILKVDPARLRLGSYQRELPQAELERALRESVSATITKAGVDALSADPEVLKRVPGMTDAAAERIAEERQKGTITNRNSLMKCLREVIPEMQARQAIGFLRVYGSDNPLDATTIHPDDYRLAERLIAHAQFGLPPAAPEDWRKPDYEKIAAAKAAVAGMSIESVLGDKPAPAVIETKIAINPDFGNLDAAAEAVAEPLSSDQPPEIAADADASESAVSSEESSIAPSEAPIAEAQESSVVEGVAEPVLAETTEAVGASVPTAPMSRPELSVDAEKLARSWQVGRAKLKSVAACLQFPFADIRDFRYPVPLRSQVPSLSQLPPNTMLPALVVGVADFGVFVELGPDCSGLVHISRLASDFVEDPHMFVQIGDVIPVWVVQVDEKRKRVAVNAIPPGTEDRKRESRDGRSSDRSADAGQTPSRDRKPSGQSDRSTTGNRPAAAGESRGRRDGGRPARSGGRDADNRRGGRPNAGRGGSSNRDAANRDRQSAAEAGGDTSGRKPVRIDKPQPQKPLTEAMQQGKEPLRSFSDLMQFMKQSKSPEASDAPVVGTEPVPAAPAAENVPLVESGSGPGAEDPNLSADANTKA